MYEYMMYYIHLTSTYRWMIQNIWLKTKKGIVFDRPTNQPTNRHEGFINNIPKRPIVQMGKGTRYLFFHKGSNLTENLLKEKKMTNRYRSFYPSVKYT